MSELKIFIWRHPNVYQYGGGIITVIAHDVEHARAAAVDLIEEDCYAFEYDISGPPDDIRDIEVGSGSAYLWEE